MFVCTALAGKGFGYMSRFFRNTIKFIALFLGVTFVLGALITWRLTVKPLEPEFFTPYIQAGIETIIPGSKVQLGKTSVIWDKERWEFDIRAEAVEITDSKGTEIADIPLVNARIGPLGFILGNLMPKELVIDQPVVRLERTKKGIFVFGGVEISDEDETQEVQPLSEQFQEAVKELSRAMMMRKLDVNKAVFHVQDEEKQKSWSITISHASIKRKALRQLDGSLSFGSLEGHFTVQVPQKDDDAALELIYIYNSANEKHMLAATFNNITPAYIAGGRPDTLGLDMASVVEMPLTGTIKLVLDRELTLLSIAAALQGREGRLIYPAFWDSPCRVKSFSFNADYDSPTQRIRLYETRIDFGGPILAVSVDGLSSKKENMDFDFTMQLKLQNLAMNRFAEIWPKPILPNPREWIVSNLIKGVFSSAELTAHGSAALNDMANLSVDGGGTIFIRNASVAYVEGMPPVDNVEALATYDFKKMDIQIKGGGIGNIRLSPFTIGITGLADVDQYIDIPLKISGPLPEVLKLLDHPPLGYAKALGIAPNDLEGKIEGTVTFRFPLLKSLAMKDVDIRAEAKATDVASTNLIPGVSVDQGALELSLMADGFRLKGPIAFGKAPFQVDWNENFEAQNDKPLRHINVTGAVNHDQWANFGTTLFNGTKGAIKVDLDLTKPAKEKTILMASLDMTPASVVVNMLGWKKPESALAILKFTATAVEGQPVEISQINLQATRESIRGSAVLSPDMSGIVSMDLAPVVVGRTNAEVHYRRNAKGMARYDIKGRSLDISGLRGEQDTKTEKPLAEEFHIQIDKLYAKGDDGFVDKVKGIAIRDAEGWKQISLYGLAGGDTPVSIDLTPQRNGTRVFKITCDNLGKALQGLGYANTLKDGKLHISGQSTVENPREIVGKARLKDFTVEDLPILARLMNATSPFGFADLITAKANFSRFEGDFKWKGDEIIIIQAHAAGSAVGINVEGIIDMNSNSAKLQGTVVPFSVMNSVLNFIPLVGDLITGGENQGILAVSYKIEGPLNAPQISVNPISLLTPGFIRNLFFDNDIGEEEGSNLNQ